MSSASSRSSRDLLIGSVLWVLSIQYFIIEFLAQRAWGPLPYTLRYNSISDLGATVCGFIPLVGTFACSPLHGLMNASFIVTGILTIAGMYFVRRVFPKDWAVSFALLLIMIGSLGSIGVGLFPENQHPVLHLISALMLFILGNFGLLFMGFALRNRNWRKKYSGTTTILGLVGIISLLMLPLAINPLGGIGLIERMVAYPLTIWLIISGALFLRTRPDVTA